MFDLLKTIFTILGAYGIVVISNQIVKVVVTLIMCNNHKLSDKKVNYITRMFYKDKNYRNR